MQTMQEMILFAARAALDAAMSESATTDAQVATDRANIQAIEAAIADVNARIAELDARIGDGTTHTALQKKFDDLVDTLTTVDANTDDLKKVQDALTTLYGASNKDKFSRKSTANNATDNEKNGITFNENRVTDNTTYSVVNKSRFCQSRLGEICISLRQTCILGKKR